MTAEEHLVLEALDAVLRSDTLRAQIRPIVERLRAELARKTEALMTWEPIPLSVFGRALPHGIRSAWVFILRAGADTGAERHPNSHQRMMSFEGGGDLQTGEPGRCNRIFWLAIRQRHWSSGGFQFHRMSGIAQWSVGT